MKRSEINALMRDAWDFFDRYSFRLPSWASWSPADWGRADAAAGEVVRHHLGWDITDFGSGDFKRCGLLLFTIRNGKLGDPAAPKPYAEKIMIVREEQLTPMHFHFHKMEDIINRGGGRLVIELWNSDSDESTANTPIEVSIDGVVTRVEPGGRVALSPGQSITLPPRLYHAFWGEPGAGTVLVGEVSSVNDDATDNRFLEPVGRFPDIEEDEPPLHLLCNEYPAALVGGRS
ncbi:MAG: D-lyxose/D-mannose family sugar isomerase [Armatimonadetes bacterium]|nr:D-lyxose/D-mannose family sugar isomerase [Armatimonadota bacterium]